MTASGDVIEDATSSSGIISNQNYENNESEREAEQPSNMTTLNQIYQPLNPVLSNLDRDDLVEYKVYQVDVDGTETYVVSISKSLKLIVNLSSPIYCSV